MFQTYLYKNQYSLLFFLKEDELNRIRVVLDESTYHMSAAKKSIPDRTKSAPHFGGVHRKVKKIDKFIFR